jgi:hypothetical protein
VNYNVYKKNKLQELKKDKKRILFLNGDYLEYIHNEIDNFNVKKVMNSDYFQEYIKEIYNNIAYINEIDLFIDVFIESQNASECLDNIIELDKYLHDLDILLDFEITQDNIDNLKLDLSNIMENA